MELIDRAELGLGPAKPELFDKPGYADGWNSAISLINKAPTVDAAPVVHGRWINVDGRQHKCSRCHTVRRTDVARDHYCPNCGAMMDGKGGPAND
jgi:hypothetical protein